MHRNSRTEAIHLRMAPKPKVALSELGIARRKPFKCLNNKNFQTGVMYLGLFWRLSIW